MKSVRTLRKWLFLAAAVLGGAGLFAIVIAPRVPSPKRIAGLWARRGVPKPNVILITMDTTRSDHLGCYGDPDARTPTLDALAARGVLFEQAASTSPLTLPAHCSIMTGMYPTYHGVRVNGNTALSEEQTTIAEVLSARGYQTGAFIAAFVLDGRWGLKQGFQYYDDRFDLSKYKHLDLGTVQKPGNEVMDSALSWLEGRKKGPFFAWIHLYDPHAPYDPPEPYRSEFGRKGRIGAYDGEIAFMDEQIGRCVSWLAQNGLDKDTVLVLIGDHGEGLGSHGEDTHGYFIYDYVVHVPFLISAPFPAVQGKRVPSVVRSIDVFPTLLELAGVSSPVKTQGRSLVPLMFRPDSRTSEYAYSESMAPNIQYGWSPLHSLRTARSKYIDVPKAEFYDLVRDPDEQTNLMSQQPEAARAMKAELDRIMRETSRNAPVPQAANLDKETIERLAALGYIGAPVTGRKTSQDRTALLADPKDKLPVFAAVTRAGELILNEQYPEAAERLESALRDDPTITQALLLLSTCYVHLGRPEEAKAQLDRILKDDPDNSQGLISLATILAGEGKAEDVVALCKRALSVDDKNVQAYMLIGEVYSAQQEHAEALPYLEKAAEIQPKLTRNRLNLAASLVGVQQYARAESLLKDIVRESPKFPLANYNLGLLYEQQGRLEESRDAYAAEVVAFPREFRARFNLGKVLLKLGDHAGYMDNMREVVKLAPDQAEGYLFLARGLFLERGSLDDVQALVEKGLSLARTPDFKAFGYFLLADIYSTRGEPGKMEDALKKARSFQPKKE